MLPTGSAITTQWLETLRQVKLVSLTVTPSTITAFGQATRRWQVTGPPTGFELTLNGVTVPRSGEDVVQPTVTTAYTLNVRVGTFSRALGTVAVNVDTTGCVILPQPGRVDVDIALAIEAGLQAYPQLYFRSYETSVVGQAAQFVTYAPEVTFQPGRIQIVLHLAVNAGKYAPDPSIDLTIGLGLGIANSALVATDPTISADVSEPWYTYLIPGALPALFIALDDAQDTVEVDGAQLAQVIPVLLERLYPAGRGMRYQTVTIQGGDPRSGPIQITACPTTQLSPTAGELP